jgi:indole-3-glycerol phosphate synthase
MMTETILDQIVAKKRQEVAERRELIPIKMLEKSIYFATQPVSLSHYVRRSDRDGIIAEIKRRSPSKGFINKYISVENLSLGYMQAGASALSILTDESFFSGKNEDITVARRCNFCPILRKDFIIDEYQIVEAKSIGADAILLIAACLSPNETTRLTDLARSLGLEVLLEVHNSDELDRINSAINIVGVNNRDLKTFDISLDTSVKLAEKIPQEFVKVSESGINSPETIQQLRRCGFQGFLIGEAFMQHADPAEACRLLIKQIRGGS